MTQSRQDITPVTIPEQAPDGQNSEKTAESVPVARRRRPTMATMSFVVAVIAWITLSLYYQISLAAGIIGLITSILALRQPRGAWRNLALISLVACIVILLVMAVFWSVLLYTMYNL